MKLTPPAHTVPLQLSDGTMEPLWYAFFKDVAGRIASLESRGVLAMPDVDNSTPITNGQVLIFDGTSGKFKPGAN